MRQETALTKRRRSCYCWNDDESSSSSAVVSTTVHQQRRRQQQQLEQLQTFTNISMFLLLITINIQTTLGFGGFSLKYPYGIHLKKVLCMTSSESEKVTTTTKITTTQTPKIPIMSITEASFILSNFDQNQATFAKEENIGMGGGVSASMYVYGLDDENIKKIRQATLTLAEEANLQRSNDQTHGRIMLGICADDCQEGLTTLKSWVTTLQLPRGLLHGMDKDGIPLDPSELGSVYIKYNSGGVMTFSEMRRSGLGFDSIWKPGDALLEPYDGDFRGVYFSVELNDDEFRQYGVLPLDLFDMNN